jgi:CheY-like chemotaxis protein
MARTILLADDSVTIQKVVELTFMDEDYEVVAVGNGDQAIAKLDEVSPDLVIADVHMPGASGYEVCRAAKERNPGLPVLLLVGTFEAFQADDAQAAGADGHLKKPFDSQELLRRVEDLLGAVAEAPEMEETPEVEALEEVESLDDLDELDEVEPLELEGEEEEVEPVAATEEGGFELERSPWDDAEEEEPVEVQRAEGLQNVETLGAQSDLARGTEALADVVHGSALEQPADEADETWAGPAVPPRVGPEVAAAETGGLSERDVDRIARRVVELLGDGVLRDIAWEVVPDLAEVVIKDRIRELERQVE